MSREEYSQAYLRGFESTVRLLLSRGANCDRAREASQAAWAKGWEFRHQLRQPRVVVAWVNSIALNIFRNLNRHSFLQLPPETGPASAPGFATPGINGVVISRVLEVCNPRERLLFEQQISGMTTREMAEAYGATETAIRIRLLRARRAVRERLERRSARLRQLVASANHREEAELCA